MPAIIKISRNCKSAQPPKSLVEHGRDKALSTISLLYRLAAPNHNPAEMTFYVQ